MEVVARHQCEGVGGVCYWVDQALSMEGGEGVAGQGWGGGGGGVPWGSRLLG